MSALSGFVSGVLGLTLLEAVVSSNYATDNATGALSTASKLIRQLASPQTPGIPDLRPGAAEGSAGGGLGHLGSAPSTGTSFNQPGSRLPVAT